MHNEVLENLEQCYIIKLWRARVDSNPVIQLTGLTQIHPPRFHQRGLSQREVVTLLIVEVVLLGQLKNHCKIQCMQNVHRLRRVGYYRVHQQQGPNLV